MKTDKEVKEEKDLRKAIDELMDRGTDNSAGMLVRIDKLKKMIFTLNSINYFDGLTDDNIDSAMEHFEAFEENQKGILLKTRDVRYVIENYGKL